MPQKRNPISSEVILAASKVLRANAGLVLDGMVSDFERASGPWHLEWVAIPESFIMASGALHQTIFAMGGLVVNEDTMMENLNSSRGLIVAEAVMMELATSMGRNPAHDVVYKACCLSIETKVALVDILLRFKEVTEKVGEDRLRKLCDPRNYLGSAAQMTDAVVELKGGWTSVGAVLHNGVKSVNGVTNGTYSYGGVSSTEKKKNENSNGVNNGVH